MNHTEEDGAPKAFHIDEAIAEVNRYTGNTVRYRELDLEMHGYFDADELRKYADILDRYKERADYENRNWRR